MASLLKNVASQHVKFGMVVAATGAADTGATVTVFVTKDGGAQATSSGTVTNLGNGQYDFAPTQADTNATDVGFAFTATSDVPVFFDFHTDISTVAGYVGIDWASINAPTTTQGLTGTTISSSQNIATATNLTNAATAGDFTATMKTSLNASTPASVTTVTGNVNGSVGSVFGAVGSVTGNIGGSIAGSIVGSVGSVLTGGLIDLTSTTYGEPSGPVAATATLKDMIVWLKVLSRNLITQTSTTETLFKDDGTTTISTSTDSDNGTTFSRGKWS